MHTLLCLLNSAIRFRSVTKDVFNLSKDVRWESSTTLLLQSPDGKYVLATVKYMLRKIMTRCDAMAGRLLDWDGETGRLVFTMMEYDGKEIWNYLAEIFSNLALIIDCFLPNSFKKQCNNLCCGLTKIAIIKERSCTKWI